MPVSSPPLQIGLQARAGDSHFHQPVTDQVRVHGADKADRDVPLVAPRVRELLCVQNTPYLRSLQILQKAMKDGAACHSVRNDEEAGPCHAATSDTGPGSVPVPLDQQRRPRKHGHSQQREPAEHTFFSSGMGTLRAPRCEPPEVNKMMSCKKSPVYQGCQL